MTWLSRPVRKVAGRRVPRRSSGTKDDVGNDLIDYRDF